MPGKESWRLILDPPCGGVVNMARDEALLRASDRGLTPPTLRLYEWDEPTLSIGRLQSTYPFKGAGVPVVRRITGGRAVLHHMELTYSVVCGRTHPLFSAGIHGAYRTLSSCILKALEEIGVPAVFSVPGDAGRSRHNPSCFHLPARHEILAGGRKLVGSSQRRFRGAFLQHGSILFGIDRDLVGRIFGDGAAGRMACVGEFSEAGTSRLRAAIARRMEEALGADFKEEGLTDAERYLEEAIAEKRYASAAWNMDGECGRIEDELRLTCT